MNVFRSVVVRTKRVVYILSEPLIRNPCIVKATLRGLRCNMSMKALVVEEFGDSSKLKYSEVSKPVPAEGEVDQLCMHASGLVL